MSSITPVRQFGPVPAPMGYLACNLGSEAYGVDILRVQEMRGYDAVARIANAQDFIKGGGKLRGVIVLITNMRIKPGCIEPADDQFTTWC